VVFVDDQPCGTVGNGHSVTVAVPAGPHQVAVGPGNVAQGMRSHPVDLEVAEGATVTLVAKGGMWRPSLTLAQGSSSAALRRTPPPPPARPMAPPPRAADAHYSVVEASRTESRLGDEKRTIDNSQSSSATSRVVRLSREWTRTATVEIDKATTVSGSGGLSFHVVDLKAGAERTVSQNYTASTEQRETYEEEVTLNIAAYTRTEVVFSWKEIRQQGYVKAEGPGYEVQIPFEVVVGLTFDQRQVDS
jgi:hypothetical protein